MSAHSAAVTQEHEDDHAHGHHHKETFVTKYIFSQDHKMIAKQYLITGVFVMGIIGILMSLLMRMQIAWPEKPNVLFEALLGKWAPDGVMDADIYLALGRRYLFGLGYYPWYLNGIFCSYRRLKWYI